MDNVGVSHVNQFTNTYKAHSNAILIHTCSAILDLVTTLDLVYLEAILDFLADGPSSKLEY